MTRDALVSRLRLMGMALPVIFAVGVLFGATLGGGLSWYIAYASIGTFTLIGLPIFAIELFYVYSPLGARFRHRPFARFITVRFAIWCAWIFIATQFSNHWFGGAEGALIADGDVWWTIGFSFAVGFTVVLLQRTFWTAAATAAAWKRTSLPARIRHSCRWAPFRTSPATSCGPPPADGTARGRTQPHDGATAHRRGRSG